MSALLSYLKELIEINKDISKGGSWHKPHVSLTDIYPHGNSRNITQVLTDRWIMSFWRHIPPQRVGFSFATLVAFFLPARSFSRLVNPTTAYVLFYRVCVTTFLCCAYITTFQPCEMTFTRRLYHCGKCRDNWTLQCSVSSSYNGIIENFQYLIY